MNIKFKKRFLSFLLCGLLISNIVPVNVTASTKGKSYTITYHAGAYDMFPESDGSLSVMLNGTKYYYSDDFDGSDIGTKLPQMANQNVVYELHDNKIVKVYTMDEVLYPKVVVEPDIKDGLTYRKGKFSQKSFELVVKVSNDLQGDFKQNDLLWFLSDKEKDCLYSTLKKLEIEPSKDSKVDFGSSGWWLWKEYENKISESFNDVIKAEEIKEYKYTVDLHNDGVVNQNKFDILIYVTPTLDIGVVDRVEGKIPVGNLDYQEEKTKEKKETLDSGQSVAQAAATLDGMTNAIQFYNDYFSVAQIDQINEFANIWMSELLLAQYIDKSDLKEKVSDEIVNELLKKLGFETNLMTILGKIHATTYLETKTKDGTKVIIQFDISLNNFDFGNSGMPTMASGSGTATIYNMDGEELGSSVILPAYADICAFCEQLQKVAKDTIFNGAGKYRNIFGVSVAEALSSKMMEKILNNKYTKNVFKKIDAKNVKALLKKIVADGEKNISNKIFELVTIPSQESTEVNLKCPVDVKIYDNDGNVCGVVKDNVVDSAYDDIFVNVVGDQKNIYLVGDDYSFEMIGTDDGSMDYVVREFDDEGNTTREIAYENIKLFNGCKYYSYVPEAVNHSSILFDLTDSEGNIISPTKGAEEEDATTDKWDGNIAAEFSSGKGTVEEPYVISDGSELAKLSNDVNSGITYEGTYFSLSEDINLNKKEWTPIGYYNSENDYSYFKGIFDGCNHIISNFSLNTRFSGIFGDVEEAELKNINVENAILISSGDSRVPEFLGGIVGFAEESSKICNCTFDGTIKMEKRNDSDDIYTQTGGIAGWIDKSSQVKDCVNFGEIDSENSKATFGGIVGFVANSKVENCINKGNLSGRGVDAGGIGGCISGSDSKIINCVNDSDCSLTALHGGIVGRNISGLIDNCINNGTIAGKGRKGGIVGKLGGREKHQGKVLRCRNTGNIEASWRAGGICGETENYPFSENVNIIIYDCVNEKNISGLCVGGILGYGECSIVNCYNKGTISSNVESEDAMAGGLIGYENGGYSVGKICNSYNIGRVSGFGDVGALFGCIYEGNLRGNRDYRQIEKCYYNSSVGIEAIGKNEAKTDFSLQLYEINKETLMDCLNEWVLCQEDNYSFWTSDESGVINDGYPYLLKENKKDILQLNEEQIDLIEGEQKQLFATSDTNGNVKDLLWRSSNTEVVQIDRNGIITAIGEGSALIRCADKNFATAICRINVKAKNQEEENPVVVPADKPKNNESSISGSNFVTNLEGVLGTSDTNRGEMETLAIGTKLYDGKSKAEYKIKTVNRSSNEVEYVKSKDKNVKAITIPASVSVNGIVYKVTSISANAFKNNKNLLKVTIGKNVKIIGKNAFYKCTKLSKVVILSKVSQIGKKAFYGCQKLRTITIKSKRLKSKSVGIQAFKGIYKKAVIKVPKKQKKAYKKWLKKKGITKKMQIK